MNKDYLGDSVYVEQDEFRGIVLTTENGYGPSNTIVLEPQVAKSLVDYIRRISGNPQWPDMRRPVE